MVHSFRCVPEDIGGSQWANMDETCITGSEDLTLRVWSLRPSTPTSESCLHILGGHLKPVKTLALANTNRVVSGGEEGFLFVWDYILGCALYQLSGHSLSVNCVQCVEKTIYSGSSDGTVRVWSLETGKAIYVLRHTGPIRCIAGRPGGLLLTGQDGIIRLWDTNRHALVKNLNLEGDQGAGVWCMQIDDTLTAAIGLSDGRIIIWDTQANSHSTILANDSIITAIQFDKQKIVASAFNSTVKIFNRKNGLLIRTITGHTDRVWQTQFSGPFLVSASLDTTVRVYDFSEIQ
mmetsp:Transcript_43305/g.70272  ORF Transcript_43305/g.70272 Transcript_43305/m.70272 type:complete len:291 (-) Transcript_43305:220-1092(-)